MWEEWQKSPSKPNLGDYIQVEIMSYFYFGVGNYDNIKIVEGIVTSVFEKGFIVTNIPEGGPYVFVRWRRRILPNHREVIRSREIENA